MGYAAWGGGGATIKEGKKDELKALLDGVDRYKCNFDAVEWDFVECNGEQVLDINEYDDHWHEEDLMEFLDMIVPYITEGSLVYHGEGDDCWEYKFDPETGVWRDYNGTVEFDCDWEIYRGDKKSDARERVASMVKIHALDPMAIKILEAYYNGKTIKVEVA